MTMIKNWNHYNANIKYLNQIRKWSTSITDLNSPKLRVTSVDGRLISFAEERQLNSGSMVIRSGDLLFRQNDSGNTPIGVVSFMTKGLNFAVDFRKDTTSPLRKGDLVELRKDRVMRINPQESEFKKSWDILDVCANVEDTGIDVFRPQPRDTQRNVIRNAWFTGIAAIDALTPIGRGQSMLFTSPYNEHTRSFTDQYMINIAKGVLSEKINPDVRAWCTIPLLPQFGASMYSNDTVCKILETGDRMAKCSFVSAETDVGDDAASLDYLSSYIACTIAEKRRDSGDHALLLLPTLPSHFVVWRRAQRMASSFYEEAMGTIPSQMFAPGVDRADLRQFYSSLVQRSALMHQDMGSGSLTTLHVMYLSHKRSAVKQQEEMPFSMDELKATPRAASELQRIEYLASKKVPLTTANLKKIGITPPDRSSANEMTLEQKKVAWGLDGPIMDETAMTQHAEELKSISDGHVVMNARNESLFDFDIGNSLTRIGIGKNQQVFGDTRPFALRQVAGPLRIQASHILDVPPEQRGTIPEKVVRLAMGLGHSIGDNLSLPQEVVLVYAIWTGMIDEQNKHVLQGGSASKFVQLINESLPSPLVQAIESNDDILSESELQMLQDAIKSILSRLM